jgi:signal transduction histidine kinase/ActR/RegA family two-component response regulator
MPSGEVVKKAVKKRSPAFLGGGGEMGALMRAHDWSQTPLSDPQHWPQSLRTAVRLILNTGHPMYIWWGPRYICFYNDAYRQSIGSERHPSSLGQSGREVWDEIWDIIGPQIDRVMTGGGATWNENHLVPITRNGIREDVYWTYSYSPIDEPSALNGIGGILVVCSETTSQVRSRQQIAEENERQRRLLKLMPGFVAVLSGHDHVFEYVNDAYITIAGPRAFLGRSVREVFPELGGQGYYELLDQVYSSGEPFVSRAMPIKLAGEEQDRFIDLLYHPIRDDLGNVTGIFVGGYDATEQIRSKAAIEAINANLNDRIAQAINERESMEEALRQAQKMEAIGQLTGGIAHDFNNLLAGITGSLEMLRARLTQGRISDVDRYVTAAQGAAKRAAALTHRLLAFARRQTLEPKPVDANRLIADMEDLIRRTMGPAITVENIGAGGLWTILVDPNQLENVLLNLCINARDAMVDGGALTIETGNRWLDDRGAAARDLPPGQYVSVCVSDTGTGMPPEVIARAFDPFFTTKPLGAGTGLGLSMTYGFARQSGGQVRIYSEVGKGAMVCLYLPRYLGEVAAIEVSDRSTALVRAEHEEVVLIVDDESTVRMLVADVLEELGYNSIEASDGGSGLQILQSTKRIDLLITDVGLPGGINGRQMADAARKDRPDLKVLFITGYAENAVLSHGHLEHGMHVLTKPFSMEALARRISELLQRESGVVRRP